RQAIQLSLTYHPARAALGDAVLDIVLADGVRGNTAMILLTARRLGFDPTRDWTISLRAVREHGFFCGWLCPFGAMQEFAHHLGRFPCGAAIQPTP
ncbi:MAG: 4Fe-4S binding protein, partial [Hyphomicrobiaceae bacterium]